MKKNTVLNLVILGSGIFTASIVLKKKRNKKDDKIFMMNDGKVISLSEIKNKALNSEEENPRKYIKLK